MAKDANVALLRGINLLGRNKVPMKELSALCEKVGCRCVRTYIQSGNVVFATPVSGRDGLGGKISAAIERQMGHRPVVVLKLPNGVAKSKLNNQFFDSSLKMVSTGRNWRTVTTLLGMMEEIA
jgi:uncharacterized protein (DUF1697 family)